MRLRFNVPFRLYKPLGTKLAVQYRVSVHHRIDILIAKLLLTTRLHCDSGTGSALVWRQLRPKGQASYKLHWSYYPKVRILSPLLLTEISALSSTSHAKSSAKYRKLAESSMEPFSLRYHKSSRNVCQTVETQLILFGIIGRSVCPWTSSFRKMDSPVDRQLILWAGTLSIVYCCPSTGEWVSSFLTEHQHIIGHFSAITWC